MNPAPASIHGPLFRTGPVCDGLLRALPDWFGIEEAIVQYVREIAELPANVARDVGTGEPVGIVSIKRHFAEAAEIHVLAVHPAWHGRGVGRALVEHTERWLAEQGVEYLQVKTLGPSRPCEHYDRTRRFYEAVGFRPLEEFKTLWNERNPCLVMVKHLSA